MHFWINKPAGRYYGFSSRRYPAIPVPKTYFNRCMHGGELRNIVTPVPRLMGLGNAVGNAAGPSNVSFCRSVDRPNTRARNENNRHGSSSLRTARLAQLNNIPNNVTDTGNNQLILSNATANGTNRSLLSFVEFSDAELAGLRLRCGIWIAFIVAMILVTAAKLYFGYRGPGLEILVFCVLLLILVIVCMYSICRIQNHGRPEHRMQEDHIAALTNASDVSVGESVRPTVPTTVRQNPPPPATMRQNPPPPPYHIAILIPPPNTMDEAPPPSYDKVMR